MNYRYTVMEDWPVLSWLASCPISGSTINIYHGKNVETHDGWFCEAIWDGPFETGNFSETDIVFGSGGHIWDNKATFVSSATTLDRLQYMVTANNAYVSNSLVCLLAATKGTPNSEYQRYFKDFETIIHGINRYKRTLALSAGVVNLVYYDNIQWDGNAIAETPKPRLARDFTTFEKYKDFLKSKLQDISDNMSSKLRKHPYRMLGTISTGYDSLTVAALARESGLSEVISFETAKSGECDSGKEIADILGLECRVIKRDAWRSGKLPEVPFIAADAKGEDVFFKGAERYLSGRVLLTGFHADEMWSDRPKALTDNIVRFDQSGMSLTEYRLWAGFLHFPPASMGVRQIRDVYAISHSMKMMPWNVRGSYNRPICRRIVEECNVPRDSFGRKKKASSVLFFKKTCFLSEESLNDYKNWLQQHPCSRSSIKSIRNTSFAFYYAMIRALSRIFWWLPAFSRKLADRGDREILFKRMFPWAMERAIKRYATNISRMLADD